MNVIERIDCINVLISVTFHPVIVSLFRLFRWIEEKKKQTIKWNVASSESQPKKVWELWIFIHKWSVWVRLSSVSSIFGRFQWCGEQLWSVKAGSSSRALKQLYSTFLYQQTDQSASFNVEKWVSRWKTEIITLFCSFFQPVSRLSSVITQQK